MSDKKIYFAASIRGGRNDAHIYREIIKHLKKYGVVFTERIGDDDILIEESKHPAEETRNQCISWILQSDVVVAEVSTPSLGVGVEITLAVENKKPVLCLYRNDAPTLLSIMISGDKRLNIASYDDIPGAKAAIDFFFGLL